MASILVFGPHPDDQELGMGGTIVKLASQGHTVHLVDMTNGEPTPHGSVEIRAKESAAAAKMLGVERTLVGLKNREVDTRHREPAQAGRRHPRAPPECAVRAVPVDAHPDHVAVTRIGEDARFDAKLTKTDIPGEPWHPKRIIYYFCTHLRMNFQPTFCIDISDTIEKKISAMQAYHSQLVQNASGVPEMVKTLSGYFGGRIGTKHAEPFFTHEVLGLGGLNELV